MTSPGLWNPRGTLAPYAWMVWGQNLTPGGVRLSAARHADVRWERAYSKYGSDSLDLSASFPSGALTVFEGDNWRAVLEGLYRRWAPTPEGDVSG